MKVMMVVEGGDCALRIDPEDDEGRAVLAALGVKGVFKKRLGSSRGEAGIDAAQLVDCFEGVPAELD